MSNVLDFLEHMGSDAQLREALPSVIEQAATAAGLEPAVQEAIVTGDRVRLDSLLGAHHVCSMMIPGKEDDSEEERQDDEDDQQKSPSPDDEVASLHAPLDHAA